MPEFSNNYLSSHFFIWPKTLKLVIFLNVLNINYASLERISGKK